MVKRLDEALGRLLDVLKSLGLAENTIVLYTSDHGCHFNTRNAGYKRSCHESSIRLPTAIQGPGFDEGGQKGELVTTVDLPPTLLEAAGLSVPHHMQGHSALRLLRGDRDGWPEEVFVQISERQVGRAIRTERWKYSVSAPDRDAFQDPASERYAEEFLYDLVADPYELANLAGVPALRRVAAELRERLLHRIREVEGAEVTIDPAPIRTSRDHAIPED